MSNGHRRTAFTLLELAVTVAVGLFILAILLQVTARTRECGGGRMKCSSNLRQLGQALFLYSIENKNRFPRTGWDPTSNSWTQYTGAAAANPFGADGPQSNDVTAALFLLLRTQEISSEVFECTNDSYERDDFGGGTNTSLNRSNFSSPRNLAYSYANPYPTEAVAKAGYILKDSMSPEFAVMSDINPGSPELLTLSTQATSLEMKSGNSPNHDRDGQNVLFGDGHVEFCGNPFVGVEKDNIFTFGNTRPEPKSLGIVGSPTSGIDSVLIPVAQNPTPWIPPKKRFDWSGVVMGAMVFSVIVGVYFLVRPRRRTIVVPSNQ
jgi:prepilin-type processing-associated H-X9-DG protein